jgi:hypothetical protein
VTKKRLFRPGGMEPCPKKRKGSNLLRLGRRSVATQSAIS